MEEQKSNRTPDLRRLRLLRLAVERQPEHLFDMGAWAKPTECGTAGCAAGSYAMQNPQEGILYRFSLSGVGTLLVDGKPAWAMHLAEHFGISIDSSNYLFSVWSYRPFKAAPIPKSEVLARINTVIAEAEKHLAPPIPEPVETPRRVLRSPARGMRALRPATARR